MAEKSGKERLLEMVTERRLNQQVADRLDRLGACVDALIVQMNLGTITNQWPDVTPAMVDAAQKAPTFYLNAAGDPFTPIK